MTTLLTAETSAMRCVYRKFADPTEPCKGSCHGFSSTSCTASLLPFVFSDVPNVPQLSLAMILYQSVGKNSCCHLTELA